MIWRDHFPLLVLLATILSSFLAILWRDEARDRWRLFVKMWLALVGGALAIAWAMLPFPRR